MRATSDEFREYAASIFRQHNSASVTIIETLDVIAIEGDFLAESFDSAQFDFASYVKQLQQADELMLEACAPINELAAAHRDGSGITRSKQLALIDAIPECQRKTAEAEQIIAVLYEQL